MAVFSLQVQGVFCSSASLTQDTVVWDLHTDLWVRHSDSSNRQVCSGTLAAEENTK